MTPASARTFELPDPAGAGRRRLGLAASVVLHVAVLLLTLRAGAALWAPTPALGAPLGAGRGGGGGGGGGGGARAPAMVYILPPPETPTEAPPPTVAPTVVPTAVPPPPAPRATPETTTVAVASGDSSGVGAGAGPGEGPGSGGGTGGGTGGGIGPGTGPGSGPGAGGEGGVIMPPVWSAGALPFGQTPKSLRGRHVDVTFWVRADGRVERTAVAPPIDDGEYLKYFQQVMQTFRFRPARDPSGAAVPGTVTMGFELPSK